MCAVYLGSKKVRPIKKMRVEGEAVLTSTTISPATVTQAETPMLEDGYGTVTVSGVTSSIDPNIQPQNIKTGVTILNVVGTSAPLAGSSITITEVGTYVPESPNNAFTEVKVAAGLTIVPSGTLTVATNGTYNVLEYSNLKAENSFIFINREIDENGVFRMPQNSFTWSLPTGVPNIRMSAMSYAFYGCTGLTSVDLSSLTTVGGSYAMYYAFRGCTGLTSVDLSSLATVSSSYAMQFAFQSCTGLTSVDLSSLTTVSASSAMSYVFHGCTGLTSVDLSSLTTVNSNSAMQYAFQNCTGLTSVDLSSLTTLSGSFVMLGVFYNCSGLTSISFPNLATVSGIDAMQLAFCGCTSLTTLSFPALTSTSFGSYTNQFDSMLSGVTGCTVHFPSNLQSVIGSWTSVTNGFGGTNTTVLFDLNSGEGGCILYNTEVQMANGSVKQVKDIKIGEAVTGYNPETNIFEPVVVTNVLPSKKSDIVKITMEDDSYIELTHGHVMLSERGWVAYNPEKTIIKEDGLVVNKLSLDDKILDKDGKYKGIKNITEEDLGEVDVYDLTISQVHTYIANGLVQHNGYAVTGGDG